MNPVSFARLTISARKVIGTLVLLVTVHSCSQPGMTGFSASSNKSSDTGKESENEEFEIPEHLVFVAKKHYTTEGSIWEDARQEVPVRLWVMLPEEISVTSGNAGNHTLSLLIDDQLLCWYKGGADIAKPIQSGDPTQIAKGKKYHFRDCEDGSLVDEAKEVATSIEVSVNNGDSTESTVIKAILDIVGPSID